jgi:hypothetical protein
MQQLHVSSLIQFHVRNTAGQRYNGTLFTGIATPDGVVNSGGFLEGTLAYEVPLTTGNVILSFVSGLGARRVEWNIKVF